MNQLGQVTAAFLEIYLTCVNKKLATYCNNNRLNIQKGNKKKVKIGGAFVRAESDPMKPY